jgi:hypothetical protein
MLQIMEPPQFTVHTLDLKRPQCLGIIPEIPGCDSCMVIAELNLAKLLLILLLTGGHRNYCLVSSIMASEGTTSRDEPATLSREVGMSTIA